MITTIAGVLSNVGPDWVEITVGGVGLHVIVPTREAEALSAQTGAIVTLYTSLQVREDSLTLFGFTDADAKAAFEALIAVSGVGPKHAISTLSVMTPGELAAAVSGDDVLAFKSVSGVGPRIAQRIVLELKGKLDIEAAMAMARVDMELIDVVTALGYSANEVRSAAKALPDDETLTIEDKIRIVLGELG